MSMLLVLNNFIRTNSNEVQGCEIIF